MAVSLDPGQSVTLTATAERSDASIDNGAAIAWQESSAGSIVSLVDHGTAGGVSTATFSYVAPGTSTVTATGTDGAVTVSSGANNPDTITCNATLASVAIVEGTPA